MHLRVSKRKLNDTAGVVVIALILFANLAIGSAKYLPAVILISILGVIYCLFLTTKRKSITAKAFSGLPFLWIFLFACEMFCYGYWGVDKDAYSLKFHLFNLVYMVMLLIIMYHKKERLIEIISKASAVEIILLSIFILHNEFSSILAMFLYGSTYRIGATAVGNENTAAVSYIFLLIPVMYQFFYAKRRKWFPFLAVGILFLLLTGSKKSVIACILIFVVLELASATNKKKLVNNLLKFGAIILVLLAACYFVPVLHEEIWSRMESMVYSLVNFSQSDQSSTGLRLTFIISALKNAWDKPILGHGWNSFSRMYGYSSLYQTNLYSHCNYTEVLFSFGLLGLFLFYWFPVLTTKRVLRNKNLHRKIFGLLFCVVLFFIDIGTVSCYQTILPFVGFSLAYICSSNKKQRRIKEHKNADKKNSLGV